MGPSEFARQLGRLDRGRRPGRSNGNANGNGNGRWGNGERQAGSAEAELVEEPALTRTVALVSPLRGGGVSGSIEVTIGGPARPAASQATSSASAAMSRAPSTLDSDEPPFPDEVLASEAAAGERATLPVQARPDQALHVRFTTGAQDQVVSAFRTLREIIHEHPGSTRVVLHVPTPDGRMQRMDLRVGVAYDAELVAVIERRIGEQKLELGLAP